MLEQHRVTTDTKTIPTNRRKPQETAIPGQDLCADIARLVARLHALGPENCRKSTKAKSEFIWVHLSPESRVKCGSSQLKDVDVERIRMLQEASARKAASIRIITVRIVVQYHGCFRNQRFRYVMQCLANVLIAALICILHRFAPSCTL